jgi:pilus assembly protein CpaE
MPSILLIDDDSTYFKMVERALKTTNFELLYANCGLDGLKLASLNTPDVFLIDIMLPDMVGFDVAKRLRQDSRFERIPIMFLTSQSDVNDKVKAFETGADDYLIKPFQPEELVARVNLLYRRGEILRRALEADTGQKEPGVVVAVHNLRGGMGCSTFAVNLAASYRKLWEGPTLVVDANLMSGQVALMLNSTIYHSWEDLIGIQTLQIDDGVLDAIINKHKSGLDFFPAPYHPIADDSLPLDAVHSTMEYLRSVYDFIAIDLAHDFSNFTISLLSVATHIMVIIAPEMASIHSAMNTLEIYEKLGYDTDRVQIVINNIFPQPGIKQQQIEKVLKRPVKYLLPYVENEFIRAINFGVPLVSSMPDSPTAQVYENIAFDLSKATLKNIPPFSATNAWKKIVEKPEKKKFQLW